MTSSLLRSTFCAVALGAALVSPQAIAADLPASRWSAATPATFNSTPEILMPTDSTIETTLSAWQAQLDQVRKRRLERGGGFAGLATPAQIEGKTGLEVMTALLEGELPHPYMADTFDCELVELGDGLAIFQATPQLKHYNPLGSVHGGWYATLLDFALGCAVQTKLPAGRGYTTSQINLNIVRAASTKTGPLRCIGTALHVGRQVGTSEARIVGPDGKLYAHATTTCAIFEAPPTSTRSSEPT